MITNISSSVVTTGRHNRTHNVFNRNDIVRNCHSVSYSPNTFSLKCTKPVLICIVAIVLPVTITFLLIMGFIMQKNNLHEYAIYTFVIFCMAFIFPFILFFFIVILNKIFKFYKRLTNNLGRNSLTTEQYNQQIHTNFRQNFRSDYEINESLNSYENIPFGSTTLHNIVVIDHQIPIDDDPPTYEMALLCPAVQLIERKDVLENNSNK